MEIKIGCKVSYPRELFEENHAERQMGVRKIEEEEWRQKGRSGRTRRTTLEMQSNRQMEERWCDVRLNREKARRSEEDMHWYGRRAEGAKGESTEVELNGMEWRMESASCEQRAGWRQSAIAPLPLPLPLPPCLRALSLCAKWDKLNRDCSKSREISTCRKGKWKKSQKRRGEMGKMSAVLLLKAEARGPLPFPLPFACLSCYRQFWMKYYDKARESREAHEIVRQRRRGRG